MCKCTRTNHKDSVAVVVLDLLKVLCFPFPVPVEGTLNISSLRFVLEKNPELDF